MVEFISWILLGAELLMGFVGVLFLISGVDDLFIDLNFLCRSLFRKLFVMPRYKPLSVDDIRSFPEQPIAIMVPAWDESAVIRRMLENTLRTLEYSKHHVFVGTYPNDPATGSEVDAVCQSFPNVHRTQCPNNGPTNKADCLNWIYQGILLFEKENDLRFEVFLMEDCEDVVHPLSLKLFNYLIPRKDMVQIPVFPLETKWNDFISGHYIDEFSEHHSKDIWVRERLSKGIPAAGVGCGFSRKAFEVIAGSRENQLFSIDSLTEDYEFGLKLKSHTLKAIFVRQRLSGVSSRSGRWRWLRGGRAEEYVAVREFLPSSFNAAVRQKSRWVLGIAFQGWSSLGWKGDLWTRYMYYRDRKALVMSFVTVLGYVVVIQQCALWIAQWVSGYRYPPLVEQGGLLWDLLLVDSVLLVNRLAWRITSVYRFYGWAQALLSIPRQVWANFINAAAVLRAYRLYVAYLRTGVIIKWDKTAHVFPSEGQIALYHKKLGDLLIQQKLISTDQLDSALALQQKAKRPLGSLLVRMGAISEAQLTEVLSRQLQLPLEKLDFRSTPPALLDLVPRPLAVRYSMFPVRMLDDGRVLLAVADRLKPQQRIEIEAALERKISLCLVNPSDLAVALRLGYGLNNKSSLPDAQSSPDRIPEAGYRRLGDVLLDSEMVSLLALEQAIGDYAAAEPQLLGDYLVKQNVITSQQLELALKLQNASRTETEDAGNRAEIPTAGHALPNSGGD